MPVHRGHMAFWTSHVGIIPVVVSTVTTTLLQQCFIFELTPLHQEFVTKYVLALLVIFQYPVKQIKSNNA